MTATEPRTTDTTTAPAGDTRQRVLIGLMLAMGLAAMDTTIVATAIPSVVEDLSGFALFAWVFSIYVLLQAVAIPIWGKLADIYGRKVTLITGIVIFIAGSVLSGISWTMVALIVFRGLQGIGAGSIQAVVSTIAGDLYDVRERARIQGWLSSVWGVSAVIGPAIGGFFAEYVSWRWIFYINVPLGVLAVAMIQLYLHEHLEHRERSIDYLGSALLAGGAGLIIFGMLESGVGWPLLSGQSALIFGLALVLIALFVWQERRAREPALPLWVFSRRLLLGANGATMVVGLLSIGLSTFLPTYAQGVLGVNAVAAGFILATMSISWPVASAFSGRFYLRVGFRNAALIGAVISVCSGLIFVSLAQNTSPWLAALGSFVMGAGLGLLSTPLIVGLQSIVGWGERGVVTGSNMFARQLGQALGAAVFGGIVNASLAGWIAQAPPTIAAQLAGSVNVVSRILGGSTTSLSPQAAAFIREGLSLATHRVFLALTIIGLAGVAVLLLTPRRFVPLGASSDQRADGSASPAQPVIVPEG